MSKGRSKGKRQPDESNSKSQKLAAVVIVLYSLLFAAVAVIAHFEWETFGELTNDSVKWLLLISASTVFFSLLIQNYATNQLRVGDAGILVGAAGTFLAILLDLEVDSEVEGILLIVLAYPFVLRSINYYRSRLLQVALTVVVIVAILLLLFGILPIMIELLFYVMYLVIIPVTILVLWLWTIAVVNGRRGK